MSEPFVGQIMDLGFNFVPQGWLPCNGQLVSIAEYEVLFTLIGTTYGGDGQTNFALPNLQSRAPVSMASNGSLQGLSPVALGQTGGTQNATLSTNTMPSHTHAAAGTVALNASFGAPETADPADKVPSLATTSVEGESLSASMYGPATPTDAQLASSPATVNLGLAGAGTPFSILNPYLGTNYVIAYEGVYPSRP